MAPIKGSKRNNVVCARVQNTEKRQGEMASWCADFCVEIWLKA